jgi:Immunity protein Imm1
MKEIQLVRDGVPDGPVVEPSSQEVTEAIRQMDGEERSQVALFVDDHHSLTIGGGPNGFVCCVIIEKSAKVLLARTRPPVDEEEWVEVVSGQPDEYPVSEVVQISAVIQAAEHFLKTGALHPELLWANEL